ncbi:hypothetical protein MLD63_03000 (plasmid) [Paracoccus sp. TK19116]|uniref:Protein ImuA n=1 Tax=Paracoccus albicereus TaxID=2922394 RepID=A0ABT1MR82_9RHOB|nr:hypothetical protein [Paracoccus albicereus]MCQ0969406.1 hypothetical protein [Paracoccus albicereus]
MAKPTIYQITAFPLRPGRVHEVGGPAAAAFAAVCIGQGKDAAASLWVREGWLPDMANPAALQSYFDVSTMVMAQTGGQIDTLAVAEEALRDGAVGHVIVELTAPLSLREGRRLQLAAQAGQSTGLCLIPEGMGSNAAETRWHCTQVPDPDSPPEDSTLQCWRITKNKSGTLGAWHVRWDQSARRLVVVSASGE